MFRLGFFPLVILALALIAHEPHAAVETAPDGADRPGETGEELAFAAAPPQARRPPFAGQTVVVRRHPEGRISQEAPVGK
jgi:hypothetical protein